jgi:hypothetical protein
MGRSLDELKVIFETAKLSDAYADVVALVEAEKKIGIEKHGKVNREAEGLRRHKIALEKVLKAQGIEEVEDLDNAVEALQDKIKAASEGASKGTKAQGEVSEMRRDLDKMKKLLADKDAKELETSKRLKVATIKGTILPEYKDKVIASDFVIENLISQGKFDVNEDGGVVFVDGTEKIDYKDGMTKFLASRPDLVRSQQAAGSGSQAGGRSASGAKIMKIDEFNKLAPEARTAWFKSGGDVTD